MAHPARRRIENVAGDFYVDASCIDCDTCRWMASDTFHETGEQSAVFHQPETPEQRLIALQALLACPTSSIGTLTPAPDLAQAEASFPIALSEDVSHCGYHSRKSFGGAAYLIRRREGNVLVDSPRFAARLVRRLEELGGVRWLYLTHRDDVADHRKFHDHFGCERILHEHDISSDTRDVERVLRGEDEMALADDMRILPVPGHTRGHTVLLYRGTYLFSGDHLAYSESRGHLYAFRDACWYSWDRLKESMRRLAELEFEWVLPGHGRRLHAPKDEMREQMRKCLEWMECCA